MTNEISKKEEIKPDLVKMQLDNLRKSYSNPDFFDGESNLLLRSCVKKQVFHLENFLIS